jgi:hypothetical protein
MSNILGKIKGTAAVLTVFTFLASALPASAFDHRDRDRRCEQRIRRAEDSLHKAERRHGEHSWQAQQKRHQLEEARHRCRY